MDSGDNPYRAVACSFHDLLQHWSVMRQKVHVVWREGPETLQSESCIMDVFTKEGAEYLVLGSGESIRLDRLVSVDGHLPFDGTCLA